MKATNKVSAQDCLYCRDYRFPTLSEDYAMNVVQQLKDRMRSRVSKFVERRVESILEYKLDYLIPQLIEFHMSPAEDRQPFHDHTKDPLGNVTVYSSLKDRLAAAGIPVVEIDIDISDFEHWLDEFPIIRTYYQNMNDAYIVKCLQHYLSFIHLKIDENDLYIDVAAAESPFADIFNKKGIKSYRLDLAYPKGMNGINIGSDASNTELPDEFASVLSLHCSYEHFMGDADIRFLKEASRILNKSGRYAIIPLYIADTYFVATSPFLNQAEIIIEKEAKRVWREDEYKLPFSRHYSPESFEQRVYSNIPSDMNGKVFYFRNLAEVAKHYEGQRIYCFFMFYCEKKGNS